MTDEHKYRIVVVTLATVGVLTAGCDGDAGRADPRTEPVDELSDHDGEFCPSALARAPQDTYGFGTSTVAESGPSLKAPDEAWVCKYNPTEVAPSGANGAWYEWVRDGKPRQLNRQQLKTLAAALQELEPPRNTGGGCTDDLGSRYLVSYAQQNDLTGVVIDTYGCDEIRLTDDPFITVPGEATQPGTVSGILYGPVTLLEDLGVPQ